MRVCNLELIAICFVCQKIMSKLQGVASRFRLLSVDKNLLSFARIAFWAKLPLFFEWQTVHEKLRELAPAARGMLEGGTGIRATS